VPLRSRLRSVNAGDGKKGVRLLLGDDLYEIPVGIAHQGAAVVVGGVVRRLDRGEPGGVELLAGLEFLVADLLCWLLLGSKVLASK
jgi:hypothetical protein